MNLMHSCLKDFLLLEPYLHRKVGFLSLEVPLPSWLQKFTSNIPYIWGLHLRREYRHFAIGLQSLKMHDEEIIFVFEIYLQHIFLLLVLLSLTGKQILLCLHWNQQLARYSGIKYIGLLYLKLFLTLPQFKAIIFEVDDNVIPEKYRLPFSKKILIPMPIRSDVTPRLQAGERLEKDKKIRVGVVGRLRKDKPIWELINVLKSEIELLESQNKHQCELIIGTPEKDRIQEIQELGIIIKDTASDKSYLSVLQEIDILVAFYDEERYYYRTSGVVVDAACSGCYVIASKYPAIEHQITYPVSIGSTYYKFSELGEKIKQGIEHIREHGQDLHWTWREERTIDKIAKPIEKKVCLF